MLSQYLKGNISFLDEVSSWEESIKVAAEPLLKKDFITEEYVQAMIDNVHENGSYMVIVPRVAMPHSKDNEGVKKTGMSFLKLKEPVLYPEGKEVNISIVLAAKDNSEHLELMADLSSVLGDEEVRNKFENVASEEELIKLIKTVE
ncbi:phosphotransferase system mannitol/fructose-specifc IIA component (Ntr-type) [Halobacteroides halobius DSM 5150]|uniref:Ascorbate-specific PTS system EIIA component n=1 Tax=Halobacteroides halobius (strain ATCC 35273 / DSM 5150 / MD-1) TaxID=748449 RepID=L0KCB7_HALHC|nr:PTS sugar transporter subunit IIA [Halobacteroides halobius]AGB42195.1 phosphotransferase system mannitol/fructose-specifc IIA component (Ntr-type) [Halobacteroides halobius DSM 5150]